jgi:hypothetical protein
MQGRQRGAPRLIRTTWSHPSPLARVPFLERRNNPPIFRDFKHLFLYLRIVRHLGKRLAFARLGSVLLGFADGHWDNLVPSGVHSPAGVYK